jgi:hypothetical protein
MIRRELENLQTVEDQLFRLDEEKEILLSELQEVLKAQLSADDPADKISLFAARAENLSHALQERVETTQDLMFGLEEARERIGDADIKRLAQLKAKEVKELERRVLEVVSAIDQLK